MGPPLTPVVAIVGPRGSQAPKIADWMREAFECRNPVIRCDDFLKVRACANACALYGPALGACGLTMQRWFAAYNCAAF